MLEKLFIDKKIIIICGHYGCGKTNIAVNSALSLKQTSEPGAGVALVDLDFVNPFFRSADSMEILHRAGIKCIVPQFANTNIDAPSIPQEIYSIFNDEPYMRTVIDVGGDDAGAVVLGMFADKIKACGYEMVYVLNFYRPLICEVSSAVKLAREIMNKSKLNITSLINNSNIGEITTENDIKASFAYAQSIADELKVPILANTAFTDAENTVRINNYTKKIF
ncbi:MAG: carbonic anhydrase [Oscillospiraceae bacterium]|nr:carbonic anhydrase [Oscillospiraceae bacterium]